MSQSMLIEKVKKIMSGTQARDWFIDEYEFRQLCSDAQSLARSESSQEFAAEMAIKAKQYGLQAYLSVKQLEYLCRLADWQIPTRVARGE